MIIRKLFTGLILLNTQAFGQPNEKPCPCSVLLGESVQKISTIYAGFEDKVTGQTRPQYDQLLNRLKAQADHTTSEKGCYEIIKQYTDWFKDRHVGIWYQIHSTASELRRIDMKMVSMQIESGMDSLQGIWSTAGRKEKYAIIKDPSGVNEYMAVTMANTDSAWKPGMVKVEFYGQEPRLKLYMGMYYLKNFNGVLNGFTLNHNRLDNWYSPPWYRNNSQGDDKDVNAENAETVQFKVLNKDFVYLKLGKFDQGDVDKLDSLIKDNRSIIYQTKNLIIDLRGNVGGNAGSSQEMIQLIYTHPIIYPPWEYRSSPELITEKRNEVNELLKKDPYNLLKPQQALLQRLIDNPGRLVSRGDSIVRTVDSIARYPERVAFLIDGGSGSAAEFFTFEGKQSKKVWLFGVNTAGGMDYGEAQNLDLSCGQFKLGVPWGRNGWIERFGLHVDNIGFKPDIPIPPTVLDWVQFVVKYWSK
jgi:hypothetical protein